MTEKSQQQGWGNPRPYSGNSKFHYFKDGVSLCRKWMKMPLLELEDALDNHPDNCTKCKQLKAKLNQANPSIEPAPPVMPDADENPV